jgi:hypothetical protein
MGETNRRVRMNVSLTSKGLVQWEVTAENDSPEAAKKDLGVAIDLLRETFKEKGLTEVGVAA